MGLSEPCQKKRTTGEVEVVNDQMSMQERPFPKDVAAPARRSMNAIRDALEKKGLKFRT